MSKKQKRTRKREAGTSYPSIEHIQGSAQPERLENEVVILALDLSTSCVGWCLGIDTDLVLWGKYVFKRSAGIGEKLHAFAEWLQVLIDTYKPDRILLEEPLKRKGNTTARHYEMLGVVRQVWRSRTGTEILKSWIISSTTVKTHMKVKRGRNHSHNKAIMVDKVNDLYNLKFQYASSKHRSDDDIADAIAVWTTYMRRNRKSMKEED